MLRGGWSLERSVSLRSGARIEGALRRLGHEPVPLDLDRELAPRLAQRDLAAVFVAVHGAGGDDGAAQGLLEAFDVPYTGSGPAAAAIAFDKPLTKRLFAAAGLPTPPFVTISSDALRDLGLLASLPELLESLGHPVVVKPARGGSALGIRLARDTDEVAIALSMALAYDREAIVERLVDGRDLAVSLIEVDGALVRAAGRRGAAQRAELLRLRGALHARRDRLRRTRGPAPGRCRRGPAPRGRGVRAARTARPGARRPDARRRRRALAARGERGAGDDRHEPAAARRRRRRAWTSTSSWRPWSPPCAS